MHVAPRYALGLVLAAAACRSSAGSNLACVCTDMFAFVGVTVVDSTGTGVSGLTPVLTVRSTGQHLTEPGPAFGVGHYYVVSDLNRDSMRQTGDTVHFAVTEGARAAAADFGVAVPGTCHCHVAKLSGPDTLTLR